MIAVDSSVVVTAAVGDHDRRDLARAVVAREARLPAHAAFESYSVLTRLPAPYRMDAEAALAFVRRCCPADALHLPARAANSLLSELPALSIVGGAVYDALIGRTAASFGARLFTMDRRALATYELVGADAEVLEAS